MTQNVGIWVNNVKVATAVATSGSAALASVSDVAGLYGVYAKSGSSTNDSLRGFADSPVSPLPATWTHPPHRNSFHGDCTILSTSGTHATGKSYRTRIIADAGSTAMTLAVKHPFID